MAEGNDTIQFYSKDIGLPGEDFFTMTNHPGDTGMDIGNELTEKLGPTIIDIRAAAGAVTDIDDQAARITQGKAVAEAMKGVFKVFPGSQLRLMAKRMLACTKVCIGKDANGEPIVLHLNSEKDFARYFSRNYAPLVPLMQKAIEHNGFLGVDVSALVMGSRNDEATE